MTLPNFEALDAETRLLVRLAAAVAAGDDQTLRAAAVQAAAGAPAAWVEELLLQSYLFCGFPRTLNGMREWRRASGVPAPVDDADTLDGDVAGWRARGEQTCETVYGRLYGGLRRNVRALHPALDEWMVVEGYGKILSRPGLDLMRRELCVVAVCAATRQVRQLHSHLHGALHAGAPRTAVSATLALVRDFVSEDDARSYELLWQRVQGK
jgi:4-carboxymuconolactone decarboxylase